MGLIEGTKGKTSKEAHQLFSVSLKQNKPIQLHKMNLESKIQKQDTKSSRFHLLFPIPSLSFTFNVREFPTFVPTHHLCFCTVLVWHVLMTTDHQISVYNESQALNSGTQIWKTLVSALLVKCHFPLTCKSYWEGESFLRNNKLILDLPWVGTEMFISFILYSHQLRKIFITS